MCENKSWPKGERKGEKNMLIKKIIFILITILCLSGCNDSRINYNDAEVRIADWEPKLSSEVGAQEIVIDKNLALEIGDSVIKSTYSEKAYEDTKLVIYDYKNKGIFVVARTPKDESILGNEICVAIDKKDGTILKIWADE